MPIITVKNWPSVLNNHNDPLQNFENFRSKLYEDTSLKRAMTSALRLAVVQAQVPGIEQVDKVTISFDSGAVEPPAHEGKPDKTLCIIVEGLFKQDDRDRECLKRLAESLGDAALEFLLSDWTVEVFVKKFDPEKDVFIAKHK